MKGYRFTMKEILTIDELKQCTSGDILTFYLVEDDMKCGQGLMVFVAFKNDLFFFWNETGPMGFSERYLRAHPKIMFFSDYDDEEKAKQLLEEYHAKY